MHTAKYIQFSGLDKVGKTTLIRTIKKQIENKGFSVAIFTELVPEPVDPIFNFGEYLRNVISGGDSFTGNKKTDGKYLGMMFTANRLMYQDDLGDLLNSYDFVLQDRGILDTLSYCALSEIPLIQSMNDHIKYKPDFIVLIHESPATIAMRIQGDLNDNDLYENTEISKIEDRIQRFDGASKLLVESYPILSYIDSIESNAKLVKELVEREC